jgi:hypothetical protein
MAVLDAAEHVAGVLPATIGPRARAHRVPRAKLSLASASPRPVARRSAVPVEHPQAPPPTLVAGVVPATPEPNHHHHSTRRIASVRTHQAAPKTAPYASFPSSPEITAALGLAGALRWPVPTWLPPGTAGPAPCH